MADDRIDNYINRAGIKSDTDFIVASLREVQSEFLKLKSISVDLSGIKGLASMAPIVKEAKSGFNSLEAAVENVNKQMAKTNGQTKELYENTLLYTKSQNELAKAQNLRNKAASDAAKNAERERKAAADASNSYLQLSKAYQEAALRAKNLQLELGKNHPLAVEATKDALRLGTELKALDASTGTFTRNVGNYGSALGKFGSKAFSFVKTAANIIPGLGLSGAFLLIFQGLEKTFQLFSKGLSDAERGQRALNEVNREAVKGYAEELTRLTLVKSKLDDLSISQSKRRQLAEDYNKTADVGNKIDLTQLNNINAINDAIDRQIEKIKQRATAKAAEMILAKKQEDFIQKQLELQNELQKRGIGADVFSTAFDPEFILKDIKSGKIGFSKLSEGVLPLLLSEFIDLKKDFDVALEAIGPLISIDGLFTDTKGDKDKGRDLAEANRKAIFERAKQALEFVIEINKRIAEDSNRNIAERKAAAFNALMAESDLIQLTSDFETKTKGKTKDEIILIQERANIELTKAEIRYYDTLFKAKKDFDKEYFEEDEKLRKDLEKSIDDVAKRNIKVLQDNYELQRNEGQKLFEQKQKLAQEEKKLYQQLYLELGQLVEDFFSAQKDRKISDLQEQINAIEATKAKDIELINQTVTNRQQAAAEIAIVEARSAAQTEQLLQRQKQLEKEKANIAKLATVFDVASDIAKGVTDLTVKAAGIRATAAVLAANPVTAALAPIALAQAALVTAQIPKIITFGALQLAKLAIPKFKDGKNVNDAYEGPAIVDDGGKPEAVIREDGSVEIGTNKPRLTYLRKNDIVLPDANMLADMVLAGYMGGGLKPVSDKYLSNGLEVAIARMEKSIVSAVQNKKELKLSANESGMSAIWKHSANSIAYFNNQINWNA